MRQEIAPSTIVRTSDFTGFAGLRVVIREFPGEGSFGSGKHGTPFFRMAYRPGEECGRTIIEFGDRRGPQIQMTRVTALIPPERPFEATYSEAAGRIASFEIEPRFLEHVVRRSGILPRKFLDEPPAHFVINRAVDSLCGLLMQETEREMPLGRVYFEGLATSLVVAVVSQTDPRQNEPARLYVENEHVRKAIAFIDAHLPSKLTRAQMAAAAHVSEFHFSRLFRRFVGLSPEEYLMECRVRYAERMLLMRGMDCPISEVANAAGFADQSHFGRCFRRAYGRTPQEYRRQFAH